MIPLGFGEFTWVTQGIILNWGRGIKHNFQVVVCYSTLPVVR
jgi:hypothetical protein